MPSFDPNIMLGILQGTQSGQAFPTSIPGVNDRALPGLEGRVNSLSPDQLNTLTTGFQNYAPTWQQGQQWGRRDILGTGGRIGGPMMGVDQQRGRMSDMRQSGGGMGGFGGGFGRQWGNDGQAGGMRAGGGK